jgi:hypothetical protein
VAVQQQQPRSGLVKTAWVDAGRVEIGAGDV